VKLETLVRMVLLLLVVTLALPGFAQMTSPNPGIFQSYSVPPSSGLGLLASEQGKQLLLRSPNPAALGWLMRFHPDAVGQYPVLPMLQQIPHFTRATATAVVGCGTAVGMQMNLEPALRALPQNEPSVDFILSGIAAGKDLVVEHASDSRGLANGTSFGGLTSIFVHRDGAVGCYGGTDFEVGNPFIPSPFSATSMMAGTDNPRVLADPAAAHKQFVFADVRIDNTGAGIGLRRTPAANFTSAVTCPAGSQTFLQGPTCLGPIAILVDPSLNDIADSPSIAQDNRTAGVGSGFLYVADTSFGSGGRSVIHLTACKPTFATIADCSKPVIVSGFNNATQFPSVAVVQGGPNAGKITVTYTNNSFNTPPFGFNIMMAVCTPAALPAAPTCANPTLVKTEGNPMRGFNGDLSNNPITVSTIPVVADRTDAAGQTTFVVWTNCKVSPVLPFNFSGCADSDVVMATSTNLGGSWTFGNVNNTLGTHEFMPAIAIDSGQNIVNIAYYHTADGDPYKNRTIMELNQIVAGGVVVLPPVKVTTTPDSTAGDGNSGAFSSSGFLGDNIGLAARGGAAAGSSRAYVGFTSNSRLGTYAAAPLIQNTEANNHVSRVTY
jgi:hypothetical protein